MIFRRARMKSTNVIRNYYVLPCCLLLLNLCVEIVSYKAKILDDPLLRTGAIMGMVLFGGTRGHTRGGEAAALSEGRGGEQQQE
jgi:hypothetical protein